MKAPTTSRTHYVDIEAIYTVNGYYGAHAFHVASGSPDITIRGGFTKAEVSLYQGTGSGAAFFAAHGVYAEGENFYRADKQVDQVQAFNMVQHAGSGGFFIDISGNSNGRPCKVTGGFTNGSIRVRDRDDFPLILDGFDRRGDNFILDDTAGERTNLIEIGRPATVAPGTHSWIAAAGIINRGPAPENDPALNVNLANGSIFRAHRTGNASLNINAPSNVDPTEDFGARITIVVLAAGTALSSCTWDSEYHFPSGNAPSSPTTNNNSVNIYEFMYVGRDTSDNDVWYCTSMTEDLSRPTF